MTVDKERMRKSLISICNKMADASMKDAIRIMRDKGRVGSVLFGFDMMANPVLEKKFGWDSAQERSTTLWVLKMLLALKHAAFYVIINEGWARSYEGKEASDEAVKDHKFGAIYKDPNRIEVISVISVCPIHRTLRSTKILRKIPNDENSKIIGFEPLETADHDLDGDFYELLNPELTKLLEEKLA